MPSTVLILINIADLFRNNIENVYQLFVENDGVIFLNVVELGMGTMFFFSLG